MLVAVGLIGSTGCARSREAETSTASDVAPEGARQQLSGYLTPAMLAAPIVGPVPSDTRLSLTIGLPVRDRTALHAAVDSVSDPRSPLFRHYMKPQEFGERFGASAADYEAVVEWAERNHFVVKRHPNRFTMIAKASVGDIEGAFHIQLNYALRPDGTRFHRPDREPSVDLDVPLASVDNLMSYAVPAPATGSGGHGADGGFTASDLRSTYISCASSFNGQGQTIAVASPSGGCYRASDINTYISINNITQYTDGGALPPIESWGETPSGVNANGSCKDGGPRSAELEIDLEHRTG